MKHCIVKCLLNACQCYLPNIRREKSLRVTILKQSRQLGLLFEIILETNDCNGYKFQ